MALELSTLQQLSDQGDYFEAQCPACAELDKDSTGVHLYVQKDNHAYRCVAHKDDSEHSRRIFALVGKRDSHKPSPVDFLAGLERKENRDREQNLIEQYRADWPRIRKDYAWPVDDITIDSPSLICILSPDAHWKLHLSLFGPDDLLRIGERYHSGEHVEPYSFTTQTNLVRWPELSVQVPLTTSAVFKLGTTSRCDDQDSRCDFRSILTGPETLTTGDRRAMLLTHQEKLGLWPSRQPGGRTTVL
jgi:hypothetical protein